MAFALVGTDQFDDYTQSSGTITLPGDIAEGDLCLVVAARVTYIVLDSAPADWTLRGTADYGTYKKWWLYSRVYQDGDDTTPTWAWLGSAAATVIHLWVYRDGFDTANPIYAVSNTEYQDNNTTVRIASASASQGNSPLIIFPSVHSETATFTLPDGWTSDGCFGIEDGGWTRTEAMHKIADSGPTGNIDITASSSTADKHGFGVILNPPYVGRNIPPIRRPWGTQAAGDAQTMIARPRTLFTCKSFFDPLALSGGNFIRRIRQTQSADHNQTPWND